MVAPDRSDTTDTVEAARVGIAVTMMALQAGSYTGVALNLRSACSARPWILVASSDCPRQGHVARAASGLQPYLREQPQLASRRRAACRHGRSVAAPVGDSGRGEPGWAALEVRPRF